MKIVNRKTRKAIRKSVKKAVRKHGPKLVAGLAGGIASTLATLASTDAAGTKRRKSNLTKVSEDLSEMLSAPGKKSRKGSSGLENSGKKKRKRDTTPAEAEL
jgi:NH3-dependent NAD+ synthetase